MQIDALLVIVYKPNEKETPSIALERFSTAATYAKLVQDILYYLQFVNGIIKSNIYTLHRLQHRYGSEYHNDILPTI